MKKIILTFTVLATTIAFAQKKEISAAYKAAESGDTATANAQISAAEAAMGGKTYLLEPAVLEQYYYAKGISLLKSGKAAEGATYLAKINDLGKSDIYVGKDSSKNKVYYVGKAAADASGVTGLKSEKFAPTTSDKLTQALAPTIEAANKVAMEAYNAKNYSAAAPKFLEVNNLLKAIGQENQQYKYYAALNYALSDNKAEAEKVYTDLINSGYTGVQTTYTAKNKEGKVESLDKNTWEIYKKMGATSNYTDFKTETSKSVEQELYETNAALMIENGKYDEAIAFIEKANKKFPSNSKFNELKGNAYYKSGKTAEFVSSLKSQLAQNPNDKVNWYNLGVLLSGDEATKPEALAAFDKVVALDPAYTNALVNATYLVMGDDKKAIDDYNALRKAGKMDEANKILEARRKRFAKAIPYAEKWYNIDQKNIEVVSLLKSFYNSTKNEAKAAEFKAKETALKAAQDGK